MNNLKKSFITTQWVKDAYHILRDTMQPCYLAGAALPTYDQSLGTENKRKSFTGQIYVYFRQSHVRLMPDQN